MSKIERAIVPERVTELRKAMGLSQAALADRIGVKQQAIGTIERGNVQRPTILHELARALGTTPEYLCGEDGPRELTRDAADPAAPDPINPDAPATWDREGEHRGIPTDASAQIDVTGGMGAGGVTVIAEGVPGKSGMTFAGEVISDYWRLPSALIAALNIRARDIAVIPVQGNSMSPTLEEGDFVFIDTRHRWPSPDGIYAIADEFGGIVVKRLELSSRPGSQDKTVRIISDNPKHEPKEWGLEEIQIIGRVMRRFSTV